MGIVTVGIDLAKNVFVCMVLTRGQGGIDQARGGSGGNCWKWSPVATRLIGMEARPAPTIGESSAASATPSLMAPKFVAPYRMSGSVVRTTQRDAAAICEAVTRPNMRFVLVKDVDQQPSSARNRTRQGTSKSAPRL